MRRRRILVYSQHLSGVGHHVRTREICRALAEQDEVFFVDGGRWIPRPADDHAIQFVRLPPILRGRGGLEPVDRAHALADVMRERSACLARAIAAIVPDVCVIEHYPFSKWDLEAEILQIVESARRANPRLRLVCSIRDACRKTRHEDVSEAEFERRVVASLNAHFDALLVHTDPRFTRLEEHLTAAGELALRVEYTGFVSEKPQAGGGPRELPAESAAGFVAVSAGGGSGSGERMARVAEAWSLLAARGDADGRALMLFTGAFWDAREVEELRSRASHSRCKVVPFSDDFLRWLQACELSISEAGYNTCTNVLQTRKRALLVPNARMSDQPFRARRFAERGLAATLDSEPGDPETLADAIGCALRRDLPVHDLDLDGARRTREIVAEL